MNGLPSVAVLRLAASCCLVSFVAPLRAQSFNIDIGDPATGPTASYDGGVGSTGIGVWNVKDPGTGATSSALVDINGFATAATISRTGGAGVLISFDAPGTSGDDAALMDDWEDLVQATWTVSGLRAGRYNVLTYAWTGDSTAAVTSVSVNGHAPDLCGNGPWIGQHGFGQTYAFELVVLLSAGNLTIDLSRASGSPRASFNGLQLAYLGTASSDFCDGASVGTTCTTCGNNSPAGRGCASSLFGIGGRLTNWGISSVSADTMILRASQISGPGMFLQSDGLAAPTPIMFGDGMLCLSGNLIRLGIVTPTSWMAEYPGGLTASPIHVAGGTSVGDVRHYQCWYRDAGSFCSAATFNLTQGLTLTWGP